MTLTDFSIRLMTAIVLGFFIGLERQLTNHPAGIRTTVLVSTGACLFTMFSQLMGVEDTTRIAAQVVTGIGFLCSGIILKEGLNVKGINTATTIWCTAAIGVITSSGFLDFAIVGTLLLLGSTLLFRFISRKVSPISNRGDDEGSVYKLSISCSEATEMAIRSSIVRNLERSKLQLTHLESADSIGDKVEIYAHVSIYGPRQDIYIEKLTSVLSLENGVSKIGWERE